jgi:hypothetical protein
MFTLIGLGTGIAYLYSLAGALLPSMFPPEFRMDGQVPLYFEAAAVIVTLVLVGQVLELRARALTGGAIRALLAWRRRPPASSAAPGARPMSRCLKFTPAICCGCVRARKFRSTASSSRAAARSTSRC